MKSLVKNIFVVLFLLLGLAVLPAQPAFTSFYVFGDALSATADPNAPGGSYFYGQRWSNGRVWVEVLAQRQGLTINNAQNNSYYDHNSAEVVTDVNNFTAPPDVANDLFIVWVCNADTFDASSDHDTPAQWTTAINQSQANHLQIITNLYAKGVRTLILPNAVDISEIPAYNESNLTNVMHNGCIAYNVAFSNTISQAMALCPGLTIYTPDYYTLLNNVLTNAAYYGLTNALYEGSNGKFYSIDAFSDPSIINLTLNGQGTNYIFWDPQDPTAKLHEIMADVAQQLISPVQINWLALFNGSNRLDVANVPVGLNGFVDGTTNLSQANWTTVTNFNSTNTTQSIFVYAPPLPPAIPAGNGGDGSTNPNDTNNLNVTYIPPFNPAQFYRLHFPYAWSWP
jgi:phospholipase/lecithinase/hemolysin